MNNTAHSCQNVLVK